MKILCVGDVVGKPGRQAVYNLVQKIKDEHGIDFVVVNAENSAGGAGLTGRIAKGLFHVGCDVLTLGDHAWDQKDIETYLNQTDRVIRPANFPEGAPGAGFCIQQTQSGIKVAVINLLGRVFMRHQVECPFRYVDSLIAKVNKITPNIIVDMHAETTSEKVAMGRYVDGRVSVLFGTHTHIQTADEAILPNATAYITDLGMTGPYDSVIGQNKEAILKRFLTSLPIRFRVAEDNIRLCGIVVDLDPTTGRAISIERISRPWVSNEEKSIIEEN